MDAHTGAPLTPLPRQREATRRFSRRPRPRAAPPTGAAWPRRWWRISASRTTREPCGSCWTRPWPPHLVSPLHTLALLTPRMVPNRRAQPEAYRLYLELLRRYAVVVPVYSESERVKTSKAM
ncbi:uncharacterized protein LOC119332877 [Triticum dicoccoides]|uniref:uncharacterized protein LOC119332877 n=1 Tax=Triticum dicoccoides TaxID=85692 RepID=UPI00189120EA|nr:uncharacterized protein LOC119332877 [Triticum dicoccoides]